MWKLSGEWLCSGTQLNSHVALQHYLLRGCCLVLLQHGTWSWLEKVGLGVYRSPHWLGISRHYHSSDVVLCLLVSVCAVSLYQFPPAYGRGPTPFCDIVGSYRIDCECVTLSLKVKLGLNFRQLIDDSDVSDKGLLFLILVPKRISFNYFIGRIAPPPAFLAH